MRSKPAPARDAWAWAAWAICDMAAVERAAACRMSLSIERAVVCVVRAAARIALT